MSEMVLKIMLNELTTVRVRCNHPGCGAIMEMTIEQLASKLASGLCPFCKNVLQVAEQNKIVELSKVVESLKHASNKFEIAFVVKPTPTAP